MFAIVTDSTSSTPTDVLEGQGVQVVPLTISFGSDNYVEGIDLAPKQFYDKMAAGLRRGDELPKTSCPDPSAFERAFARALERGADGVLCITLSSGLSGTNAFANVAAENTDGHVEVVDSKAVAMEETYLIEQAIRMRDAGATLAQTAAHLREMADNTITFFALDTMENLIKGGRVGKAAGIAAGALKLKALLCVEKTDGVASGVGKARGSKGAMKKLVELTQDFVAQHGECEVRVIHADAADRVVELEDALEAAGIACNREKSGWIGAVIGTHAGLAAVAAVCCPRKYLA